MQVFFIMSAWPFYLTDLHPRLGMVGAKNDVRSSFSQWVFSIMMTLSPSSGPPFLMDNMFSLRE